MFSRSSRALETGDKPCLNLLDWQMWARREAIAVDVVVWSCSGIHSGLLIDLEEWEEVRETGREQIGKSEDGRRIIHSKPYLSTENTELSTESGA